MDEFKTSAPPEARLHFLDYWRGIRIRKAIIVTVFLITAIIATAVTFILPESYSSTARIEVENDVTDIPGMTGTPSVGYYDPYFIQTTFEIMQSQLVLSNVISALNLNTEWGKKYFNGETLKTTETMEILKQRMQLSPVKNTKLIAITVFSDDRNEAAQLANAIADAYKTYRFKSRRELTENGLKTLEEQFQEQDQEIKTNQDVVEQLRQQLHITDTASASMPTPTLNDEQLRMIHQQQIEGQRLYKGQLVNLQELKSIQETNKNKLCDVLPQMVQDGALNDLLGKLHEAQQKWVTLTNDYNTTNILVARVQSLMDELNREIDDRVIGIMASLESQVNTKKAELDAMTEAVEAAKLTDQEEAKKNQPYYDQKRNLDSKLRMQKLLYSKLEAEKLDLELPKNSMVQITDTAEPGKAPVKPNKTVNIVLGLVFGLIMGIGLAFFIEYLDTSVKTIDDVERTFQAPVLGVIPQNIGYLIEEGSESKHAEAYRVLRTNLLFSRKDEKLNTIVVVSAGAGADDDDGVELFILAGEEQIRAQHPVGFRVLAFGAFFDQVADVLRNDAQHWRLERAFDIVNRLHTGVEIFDEEGQTDAHDEAKDQPQDNVDGLVGLDRRLARLRRVGDLHHGVFRQFKVKLLRFQLGIKQFVHSQLGIEIPFLIVVRLVLLGLLLVGELGGLHRFSHRVQFGFLGVPLAFQTGHDADDAVVNFAVQLVHQRLHPGDQNIGGVVIVRQRHPLLLGFVQLAQQIIERTVLNHLGQHVAQLVLVGFLNGLEFLQIHQLSLV